MGICNWPNVLEDPKFEYDKSMTGELLQRMACADGLMGWALCMSGNKPPKNFGHGMIKISKIIGMGSTHQNIEKFAKEKGWLNDS